MRCLFHVLSQLHGTYVSLYSVHGIYIHIAHSILRVPASEAVPTSCCVSPIGCIIYIYTCIVYVSLHVPVSKASFTLRCAFFPSCCCTLLRVGQVGGSIASDAEKLAKPSAL